MISNRLYRGRILSLWLLLAVILAAHTGFGVNVVTYHNDNSRTGQNTNETVLSPATVNTNTFGKLFTNVVDGAVYAQPLVLTGVTIPGKGVHDVVYIATEHDTVYAFDADGNTGANATPLWTNSFINPAAGVTTLSAASISCSDITPEIGITGTPVIDPATGTLYVEAKTVENNGSTFVHRLHALDVTTGAEKFGGPVVIQGSAGGATFYPLTEINRSALLLNNGTVYVGFASHCDINPYYGWLFGYNAANLALTNIFNVAPHGYGGAIFISGAGPAADTNGNVYIATGIGTFDGAASQDYANSFLKLTNTPGSSALAVATSFTPWNQSTLTTEQYDLGSGGTLLLPDEAGSVAHPHLLVGAGKGGDIYLVDRDNMGGYSGGSSDYQIVQSIPGAFGQCFDTPAYFNHTLYYCAPASLSDYVRAFTITNGAIGTSPTLSPSALPYPGATCTVSASGTNNGVVWAIDSGASVLHAYNATNVALEIYNSLQASNHADSLGTAIPFSVPTVANGRVYVGASNSFVVYGFIGALAPTLAAPVILPNGGLFTNSLSITLTDATPGALIYYTLNGSTPATNSSGSFLYGAPVVISNSLTLQAGAFLTGSNNSAIAAASFTNYVPVTVATPVITPLGGLFTNSLSITLTDATPGAAIFYTLDGSTPTTNSLSYSAPVVISNSLTLQVASFLAGDINSAIASAMFTNNVTPAVATPVIIPNGGSFTNSISISITDATPSSLIFYTVDGSTPTNGSLVYSTPVVISNSLTLRAGAFLAGSTSSGITSASFTNVVLAPVISPLGGLFTNSLSITLTDPTPSALIYYTLDGSTPINTSLLYSNGTPVVISNSLTLRAGAFLAGAINSGIASASYTNVLLTPVIAPLGGLFTNSFAITLTDATPGALIYYTLDGSTPATNSSTSLLYGNSNPVVISNSLTLQAGAFLAGAISSGIVSASYTNVVAAPVISPNGGSFNGSVAVTLTDTTPGAAIYYTLNGSTPTNTSLSYSNGTPLLITNSLTLQAQAFLPGSIPSAVASASFTYQPPSSAVNVLTYHNNNARTGLNANETTLTLANVNTNSFGLIYSQPVDGYVYSQPLVLTGVAVTNQGTHDVVFVCTEHGSVYAFDAYTKTNALWFHSFLNPAAGVTTVSSIALGCSDISSEIGITSTPVIDPVTGTLYVEVLTAETTNSVTQYVHRLHALDVRSGLERTNLGWPALIQATVPGTGEGATNNGFLSFNGEIQMNRPGLLLNQGVVDLGFASHCDLNVYHGWLLGYSTQTATLTNIYCVTPNGVQGGIWAAPAADSAGNIYVTTGNGVFDANIGGIDYAQSIVKLTNGPTIYTNVYLALTNGLGVADYFTPHDQSTLSSQDLDLGSGGPMLLPDEVNGPGANTNLIVCAGKNGTIYLTRRNNLGIYNSANDNQIVQTRTGASGVGECFCTPAYFNHTIYYFASTDYLRAFPITNGVINNATTSQNTLWFPGDSPSISANGTNNGIVWILEAVDASGNGTAILHAFNATNLTQELYNTSQAPGGRDSPGMAVKFAVPTVANGYVYVGGGDQFSVYGLFASTNFVAAPVIIPNGGVFTNVVQVTITNATPGATNYYTLDGTTPTANSTPYTGPFQITATANLQVRAFLSGYTASPVTSASFVNTAAVGNGLGLTGQYWTNTTAAAFTNGSFNTPATLVRTDAVINFNWGTAGPDPKIGGTNFTVRWTGCVQPQYSGAYTFITSAADGVRLYLNGQLLINNWANQTGPATNAASVSLAAQQYYNVELDYYENTGNASVSLSWSNNPNIMLPTAVPVTQLYPFTNPPPLVVLTSPAGGATNFTAPASVTISAAADATLNPIASVSFYANTNFLGSLTNTPYPPAYTLTATGMAPTNYALTAVAVDSSGLATTSAPVDITVATNSNLSYYGLTNYGAAPAFFNLPTTFNLSLTPTNLSQTGIFSNTPAMIFSNNFIPYQPITPLWSDGAVKYRYFAVPNNGGTITPNEQIAFTPTNHWTFPAGTVFVKTFQLVTNTSNPSSLHRLETRLLVCDINGAVYGVTYKWRPDNSDADLLTGSLTENIVITNGAGAGFTQTWYYPSPADCLQCHTPVAGYVLGLNTRQFNRTFTYTNTGVMDNELRALNRLGLFNPAFNEAAITNFEKMSSVTNASLATLTNLTSAALTDLARSYLDANCAQCHQPGGTGPTFDARYDTPLGQQNLTNVPAAKGNLGYPHAMIVRTGDYLSSMIYERMNTTNPAVAMPPLARSLIDVTNTAMMAAWIGSLPLPALTPPVITPAGGTFYSKINVTLQGPDTNAVIYYTLNGTPPTNTSPQYSSPLSLAPTLATNFTLSAYAVETNFNNSGVAGAVFTLIPVNFTGAGFATNHQFKLAFVGVQGSNYVLQATTNFINWTPLYTNLATSNQFNLFDPQATNFHYRFYRVQQQP